MRETAIVVAYIHYWHSLSVAPSLVADGFRSSEGTFCRVCRCNYVISLLGGILFSAVGDIVDTHNDSTLP